MRHGINRLQLAQAAACLAFSLFIVVRDKLTPRDCSTCASVPLFVVLRLVLNLCGLLS